MIAAVTVAPAGERVLGAGAYLGGVLELALALAAIGFGARRVRALLLPGWNGAPARLAEIVLGAAGLLWTSEILGTFGGFREGAMLAALVAVGIATGLYAGHLASRRRIEPQPSPPLPAASSVAKLLALATVAGVTAGWMVPTLGSVAAGMDRADTLWYHMPLAARFAQTGHLGQIFFFDPVFFASFYPANSEVFHSLGILFFGRDILSPLMNDGWLAVALLSSYCIGRPYGLGPQSLIGGSVALGAQMLVEFQAGEGLNDITGLAFLLAAAALLVNAHAAGGWPGSPGIAPGGRSRVHASHRPRGHVGVGAVRRHQQQVDVCECGCPPGPTPDTPGPSPGRAGGRACRRHEAFVPGAAGCADGGSDSHRGTRRSRQNGDLVDGSDARRGRVLVRAEPRRDRQPDPVSPQPRADRASRANS